MFSMPWTCCYLGLYPLWGCLIDLPIGNAPERLEPATGPRSPFRNTPGTRQNGLQRTISLRLIPE